MNIQFAHCRKENRYFEIEPKGGSTLAIIMPSVTMLDKMEVGGVYPVSIGIARCHEDDRYNKKIGRDVAKGRIQERFCKVGYKHIGHDYIDIHLEYKGYVVVIQKRLLKDARVLTVFTT